MERNLKSGNCPKCGSTDVYFTDNAILQALPTTYVGLDRPKVDNYACGACGYAEFFITDDTLDLIRTRWHKIGNKQ